jgi:hypothetical protein
MDELISGVRRRTRSRSPKPKLHPYRRHMAFLRH